jgi:dipeptidyl aminopeptidase/acylaminoacyl peptidase/ectoine hydroxylase-related dioxygenase (phytanoyl-CoA dioxygenase family)
MDPTVISEDEAQFFQDNGYLILRGVLQGEELRRMQAAMEELTEYGRAAVRDDPDYMYGEGHKTGARVLKRIEYVIDKRDEAKVLLGNPSILRSVERLMGKDLIPTWDSMVLKLPGEGIIVPWHRDAATDLVGDQPIFNVDFYLDEADEDTCVWVMPGSHLWSDARIDAWLQEHRDRDKTKEDFRNSGAVPALMQPGDTLIHNILVLHGSPSNVGGKLRRVVYYEFRTAHVEEAMGPHVPAYIPLKQKELLACIRKRKEADYIPADETPYVYNPPPPYDTVSLGPDEKLETYRYAHGDYWRPSVWTAELSMQVKGVSQVRVSPDGRRVAYTVTTPVMEEEKSEYLTHIWLARADGSDAFQATFGDKSTGNPQWSPDGRWLAFTSRRTDKNQLYLMRADGGEAEPLTDVKADIGIFAWSPDSSRIAFVMADPKTEEEEKRDKSKDDSRWVDEDFKMNRLYVLPIRKDAAGKREPRQLTTGNYHVGSFDWSPDSNSIAFDHAVTPRADDWLTADVSIVDVATGEAKPLVTGGEAAFRPLYSPDGRWIALMRSEDPPRWAFYSRLHIVPATGGVPHALPATFDGQPGLAGWDSDGTCLFFSEARGTQTRLYALHLDSGEIREISPPGGMLNEVSLNATRTHFGFTMQSSERPVEAFVASAEDFTPVQVSRANADVPSLPLGKTEVIRWKSTDGLEIEGLLTYPVGYQPGRRVPLLLSIHGGPTGVFQENFIAAPMIYPIATFAAGGYAILRGNPRGSSGYGKEFRYANRKDWGGGDYRDLMAGVDHVIAMGVADPDRLGVMGWSYGGFMTSWVITQTKRFRAASVGAGVTNLMSFNGTSDIPGFIPDYFGAESWEDLETYRTHSAMFQVGGVTTPTLIQHGDQDIRVPISQGYELYNALKRQSVETRMIVLPRQPHGPNEPRMQLKVMQTNLEWFDKYLK